ncbi:DUF2231 domain-containing protein [Phycicoccus sp. Root101]|uniref:DUF2231 domain-containing protein n=1 Tax=Phycicoccus sp. Root101 TaxID=1736421 RepID=UPI000702D4C5|nr:DUF2231 domain-containing protein [Phycicoccus sp. Root101]KQU67602.1 hypothetical protein ASC58_13810 [Phycicoccus sp. Root101]
MEINGLPAHALLVHLVVVLLPLTAVAAMAVSVWPAAQRKLTFLVPLGAVVGLVAVPVTTRAGNDLATKLGNPAFIDHHRSLGSMVLPWAAALAVTTVAQWLVLRREQPDRRMRLGLAVLVLASAVGTAVIVALAGDAGAQAVWGKR